MVNKTGTRLVSLDIFRGLTIAFMIIVNDPGSWSFVYPPLQHSEWNGCTPTDLVYPFFLFIVGISVYYSMKKYGNEINGGSLLRIFRRTVTIFAIGLFLSIFPNFGMDYSKLRIMGVLQRIALAYGLGSILCLTVRKDYLWIVIAALLLLYWGLLAFFGGTQPYSLGGNLVLKIDLAVLGKDHMYSGFGIPFEPEGLLSTIPSICTVLIGYFIGTVIDQGAASWKTVAKLILLAGASFGLGYLWNIIFPVNKPLWTSSYVLYTAGLAMATLAFIYLIADIWKFVTPWTFFIVFGTNAMFCYFITGIWIRMLLFIHLHTGDDKISLYNWIYNKLCVPVAGNMNGSLLFAFIQMLIIWGIAFILYRKKIFIRL